MFRPAALAAALTAPFILGACATPLTAESCQATDWSQLGYSAAAGGQVLSGLPSLARECAELGVEADRLAFAQGAEAGTDAFCTPARVLEVSLRRRVSTAQCGDTTGELHELALLGADFRQVEARANRVVAERDRARATIRKFERKSDKRRAQISAWESELRDAKPEHARNLRREIADQTRRLADDRHRIRRARRTLRDTRWEADRARRDLAEVRGAVEYARRGLRY